MTQDYVALLGTKGGPAIRPKSSMPTANLLSIGGQQIVVDCGLGVTRGLVDQGMELRNIREIFITHLHSDHYLELGPLLHTAWTAGLTTPVEVWGPAGLETYWQHFVQSMMDDIALRIDDEGRPDLSKLVTFHLLDTGEVYSRVGLRASAIRTIHPPLVDCFALSFKTAERHVVFSGDTAPLAALADFAKDADLLVHEAMLEAAIPALIERVSPGNAKLRHHIERSHCYAQDAARTARAAGVQRLAFNHRIPADDPSFSDSDWLDAVADIWQGALFIGKDGMRIDL